MSEDSGTKRSAFRQPEMIVALSAIVLSLCGLFIALYEASIARQAERASVWPHVEVAVSVQGTHVEIWVRNSGVGPARIKAASLTYQDEVLNEWSELVEHLGMNPFSIKREFSLINGRVLGVDSDTETIFAIDLMDGITDRTVTRPFARAFFEGSADVELCYCSVYDQCWITSLQDIMNPTLDAEPDAGDSGEADCAALARSGI